MLFNNFKKYIERDGKAFEYFNHYLNKGIAGKKGKALKHRGKINNYRVIKKTEMNRLTGKEKFIYVLYVH